MLPFIIPEDPDAFPDSYKFNPDRWLGKDYNPRMDQNLNSFMYIN